MNAISISKILVTINLCVFVVAAALWVWWPASWDRSNRDVLSGYFMMLAASLVWREFRQVRAKAAALSAD